MLRQFADVSLAQLSMPIEDKRREGSITQESSQIRLGHPAFLHRVFEHSQGIALS